MRAELGTGPGTVRVASGCGGTGPELRPFTDLEGLWFSTRTLTLDPWAGLPGTRVVESPSGFVHAVGEPNPGLETFTATELPALVRTGAHVMVSISGRSPEQVVDLARRVGRAPGISGIELNLAPTSPGLLRPHGAAAAHLATAVRGVVAPGTELHAKVLTDDTDTVVGLARVCDAVVVSGSSHACFPDGRAGQLSGPAVLPVTMARVRAVSRALTRAGVECPVVAVGGVTHAAAVSALLVAGARAVQVGSALLHDPTTLNRLTRPT